MKEESKKKATSSSSPPPTRLSFSLLPDEIIENCLARIPRSYYVELSLVSKSFRTLLSSTELYAARSRLGTTQPCLYVCLDCMDSCLNSYSRWITLSINPNRTKKNMIGQQSVPIPFSNFGTWAKPLTVGSKIYVIGCWRKLSSTVKVLDCRSHTWHDAPSMNVARDDPVSYVYDGKIYVIGGINTFRFSKYELWGEVFNIKTQAWEYLPKPSFANEDRIHNYYYDPKQCKWEKRSAWSLWPECVMDNVSYSFQTYGGRSNIWWRDINGGDSSKEVKGLDSLGNMYKMRGGSSTSMIKVTSCGGKFYVMWEWYERQDNPNDMVKIFCAEISLEKRDKDDIWGNVEWLDVVHTTPTPCHLLHCLAISL